MTMRSRLKQIVSSWFKKKTHANRLFDLLRGYASLMPTTLCMLHEAENNTPCPRSRFFCGTESTLPAINFDKVKETYCNKAKISYFPSVDAVMFKGERFFFVEIKSWQNFERFQIKPGDGPAVIQKKIEDKAKGFKLKPKVEKSMKICQILSKDEHLFEKMPVTYVLVTDVNTVADPLARFKGRLRDLAYKSVYIPLFSSASTTQLATVGMDVRYVFCRSFDDFYAKM